MHMIGSSLSLSYTCENVCVCVCALACFCASSLEHSAVRHDIDEGYGITYHDDRSDGTRRGTQSRL